MAPAIPGPNIRVPATPGPTIPGPTIPGPTIPALTIQDRPVMTPLFLALAGLLISHFALSRAPIRDAITARIGEKPFLGLYSLITVVFLVWVVLAYRAAESGIVWWQLGSFGVGVAYALSLLGVILLVTGVSGPNPTAVANQPKFSADSVQVVGVLRITRNPVMWGMGLWALGHLAANGEAKVVITMVALFILSAGGTLPLDAKMAARKPEAFAALKAETTNLPFLALLTGRQSWSATAREIGITRPLAAVAVFILFIVVHRWIAGVPLIGF